MEHSEGSSYSPASTSLQYPDPDYAAHVTKYPWVEEENEPVQQSPSGEYGGDWRDDSRGSSKSSNMVMLSDKHAYQSNDDDDGGLPVDFAGAGSDYQMSDEPQP